MSLSWVFSIPNAIILKWLQMYLTNFHVVFCQFCCNRSKLPPPIYAQRRSQICFHKALLQSWHSLITLFSDLPIFNQSNNKTLTVGLKGNIYLHCFCWHGGAISSPSSKTASFEIIIHVLSVPFFTFSPTTPTWVFWAIKFILWYPSVWSLYIISQ